MIELDPTHFDAHRHTDWLLSQQQRWNEVPDMWNAYIAHTPANAEAYFERGGTNYRKGDLVAAQARSSPSRSRAIAGRRSHGQGLRVSASCR